MKNTFLVLPLLLPLAATANTLREIERQDFVDLILNNSWPE